jgi:hypothetical protein
MGCVCAEGVPGIKPDTGVRRPVYAHPEVPPMAHIAHKRRFTESMLGIQRLYIKRNYTQHYMFFVLLLPLISAIFAISLRPSIIDHRASTIGRHPSLVISTGARNTPLVSAGLLGLVESVGSCTKRVLRHPRCGLRTNDIHNVACVVGDLAPDISSFQNKSAVIQVHVNSTTSNINRHTGPHELHHGEHCWR